MNLNKLVKQINEEDEDFSKIPKSLRVTNDQVKEITASKSLKAMADSQPDDIETQLASHKDLYIKNILQTAVGGNKAAGLRMYDAYKESGKDFKSFLQDMIETIKKSGVLYTAASKYPDQNEDTPASSRTVPIVKQVSSKDE